MKDRLVRHAMTPLFPWLLRAVLLVGQAGLAAQAQVSVPPPAPCGSNPAGATCGAQEGPASVPSMAPGMGANNPINVTNGNKYQREVDLAALPGVLGLELVRHYNSDQSTAVMPSGSVGRGWRLSYETWLHAGPGTLQIVQADGTRHMFDKDARDAGLCVGRDASMGRVRIERTARGEQYIWTWRNGRELSFDAKGQLVQIRQTTGEFVSLQYDLQGRLLKVTDPQGRSLTMHYLPNKALAGSSRFAGIQHIDTPVGRYEFRHGGTLPLASPHPASVVVANLVGVKAPGGVARTYHYEDARFPTLLTGISLAGQANGKGTKPLTQRISSYAYDARGWAVRSEHGGVAVDLPSLERAGPGTWGRAGRSVLVHSQSAANPGGAKLEILSAQVGGQYRIVETRGTACPAEMSCPEANIRWRYDDQGRLTGRVWHAAPAKADGPLGPALFGERVVYDQQGRISHVHELRYDAQGKLREQLVEERRYAAAPANLLVTADLPVLVRLPSVVPGYWREIELAYNEVGQMTSFTERGWRPAVSDASKAEAPEPISRIFTWRYELKSGRSVLARTDGPLPNGPLAQPVDSDVTRYEWDEHGRFVQSVVRPTGLKEYFKRDEAGRVVAHQGVDGVAVNLAYRPTGEPTHWERGPTKVAVHYDSMGRAERIELPDGEVRRIGYDQHGQAVAMTSNAGWARWLRNPTPEADSRPAHLGEGFTARQSDMFDPWAGSRAAVDDFGRLVQLCTVDTGCEQRSYDQADRLQERVFADGTRWTWRHDAMGRVVNHEVSAPGRTTMVTRLQYDGAHLARIDHPHESSRMIRDAWGRLSQRTVIRHPPAGRGTSMGEGEWRYTERYAYDAADRVTRMELPEGGQLDYVWGVGKQLQTITRTSAWAAQWVPERWGWGRQVLIEPLQGQATRAASANAPASAKPAAAPRGYRWGNGVALHWQQDERGRLSSMTYVRHKPEPSDWTTWLTAWIPEARADGASQVPWMELGFEYDQAGRMSQRKQDDVKTAYAYDRLGRLLVAQSDGNGSSPEYYAYGLRGEALGQRVGGTSINWTQLTNQRQSGGLPVTIPLGNGESRDMAYSADRRLVEVKQGGQMLATYWHNPQGKRIGKQVAGKGGVQFLWQQGQLVGETLTVLPATKGRSAKPRLHRRYVYANGVPVALIHYERGVPLDASAAQGWLNAALHWAYEAWVAVAQGSARILYLHSNEIGTPLAATDDRRNLVWQAGYTAFGLSKPAQSPKTIRPTWNTGNEVEVNLRMPGQYFDAETGWHDNGLRTYDPSRGQYLEPDPLGPLANRRSGAVLTQPYAYANHNPLIYADPSGLILFAFDGTGNDRQSRTNVLEFALAYDNFNDFDRASGKTGDSYYVEGVSTAGGVWDNSLTGGGLALELRDRINRQLLSLDEYVRDYSSWMEAELGIRSNTAPVTVTMDIVGFSRGAAAAREFSNQIVDRIESGYFRQLGGNCLVVDINGMWLFDTVLSTNPTNLAVWPFSPLPFRMVIPSQVRHVAHAVSVNEYRAMFPLESIAPSQLTLTIDEIGPTRHEKGFVGAHSDIGGGYRCASGCDGGDLSDVALNWMVRQAELAGVKMKPLRADLKIISRPLLHDESRAAAWRIPGLGGFSSDRYIRFRGDKRETVTAARSYAKSVTFPSGMNYAESLKYIHDREISILEPFDTQVGYVRLCGADGYLAWIREAYKVEIECS